VLGVFVHYVRFGRKDLEGTERTETTDLKNGATKPTVKTENK